MTEHRITMDRPGVYRITAARAPASLVQRLWRFLFTYHRPAPQRPLAPTLAGTSAGAALIPTITIAVSLAALRRARPNQETTR
jgi:hypothetical protein